MDMEKVERYENMIDRMDHDGTFFVLEEATDIIKKLLPNKFDDNVEYTPAEIIAIAQGATDGIS